MRARSIEIMAGGLAVLAIIVLAVALAVPVIVDRIQGRR